MRKMIERIVVFGLVVLINGCVTWVGTNSQRHRAIMTQVGVLLTVVNNTEAPCLRVERSGSVFSECLIPGQSTTVPLASSPFGGPSRQIVVTAKGYDGIKFLGADVMTFQVSTYRGSYEETWVVDYLRSP